ncbi:hypothetical protein HU200_053898 [Digitaria exilis]|uniref:MLO-like protein n=1 Tax=Digitaria exilis TaxID=1010633 RepID=A0A835AGP4_9POAL|nr:hypothetical protein HU200_053898 [Digitaria exilis]
MGGDGGGGNTRELDQTPTWAVASVCGVIVIISILLEKGLHHVGEFFSHRKKKAMVEALEKVKAELMVLGFISLLLVFGQNYIIKICISNHAADTMLPCKLKNEAGEAGHGKEPSAAIPEKKKGAAAAEHLGGVITWPPPYYAPVSDLHHSRLLGEANMKTKCPDGKVSLISINALHQLHIFIFFLAVFHVSYSAITMALGRAKIRAWKEWEKEAAGQDYEFSNDPTRFRFTHETSFVRQHMNVLNKTPASFYIVHLAPGSKFDFQKYIKRSLEDDFKVIVGISPPLWASALIFLLLNVNGWHTMLWISIMPVVIILSVGTKLQGIICRMAIDITERHAVIQGIPLVQNGFQIIYFLWILMGSTMKQSIFDEQTSKALKNWRAGVKKKAPTSSKHGGQGSPSAGSPRGGSPTKADGIDLAERKNNTADDQADTGTGLQAGASQAAAKKGNEGDYEFINIDE